MADEEARQSLPPSAQISDSAAWAALNAASREKADAFLDEQSELTREQTILARLQAKELAHELRMHRWSLRFANLSAVLKVTFEIVVALIGLAIVAAIGAAVWTASNDTSLVIESFTVPPDMANRGLSGQAVAAQLEDRLSQLQDASISTRPAASYVNNWGEDIKVQIPDTGVSIGEVYRLLAAWLGHQTRITGEVFHSGHGLAIALRATAAGSAKVTGTESDFDALIGNAAEAIYARTQPYRYATYIEFRGRAREAQAILESLSVEGATARERAWAWNGLGFAANLRGDNYGAAEDHRRALALEPNLVGALANLAGDDDTLGHDEEALLLSRELVRQLESGNEADIVARARPHHLLSGRSLRDSYLGDFRAALADLTEEVGLPEFFQSVEGAREAIAANTALLHSYAQARRYLSALPSTAGSPYDTVYRYARSRAEFQVAFAEGDWAFVLDQRRALDKLAHIAVLSAPFGPGSEVVGGKPASFVLHNFDEDFRRIIDPSVAYADARSGNYALARRTIDATPLDCYLCLHIRARIDAAEKNWTGATYWFWRSVRFAPSLPFAYSDWGEALLTKGEYDAAIEKFREANLKGPHFADPLEMWGEALMHTNRSDLALAKFEEANKYAPNWGRLHLKWGEALTYAGDLGEAAKQFTIASQLNLSQSDNLALARHLSSPACGGGGERSEPGGVSRCAPLTSSPPFGRTSPASGGGKKRAHV